VRYAVQVADGDGVAADGGSAAGTAGFAGIRGADDIGIESDADWGIPRPVEADTADDVAAKQHHFCFHSFQLQHLDAATHQSHSTASYSSEKFALFLTKEKMYLS
jgi:hypothetical protein